MIRDIQTTFESPVEENFQFMKTMTIKGLKRKGVYDDEWYQNQLEEELEVIQDCGLEDFFLQTAYICALIDDADIFRGPARGCLSGDSLIYTKHGFCKIKDIKKDKDYVLCKDGEYHKVINTFEYDNSDSMIEIQHYMSDFLSPKFTPDHKILVSKVQYTEDYIKNGINKGKEKTFKRKKYSDKMNKPEWIPASDIRERDWVVIPKQKTIHEDIVIDMKQYADEDCIVYDDYIIEYARNGCHQYDKKIPRYYHLDYDFGYFIGVFCGDGWLTRRDNNNIGLCCHANEDTDDYILKIIKNTLGIDYYYRNQHNDKQLVQYTIKSRILYNFIRTIMPDYQYTSQTKTIPLLDKSNDADFLMGILDGMVSSDGHISNAGRIIITSSSEIMIRQLRYIALKLNIVHSIRKNIREENRGEFQGACGTYYTFETNANWYTTPKRSYVYKEDERYIYLQVRNIIQHSAENKVYDLSIDGEHNFMTNNFIVHNSCLASVVCYGLNITKIDPKPYDLSFARFLNKTRAMTQLPDIDTDVSSDQRDEVLSLIKNAFGEEYCGQVITKLKYTPKVLIKDLASAKGIDYAYVNRITSQWNSDEDYHDNDRVMEFLSKYPEIGDYIDDLTGLTKSYGVHPGAIIIFDDTMYKYVSKISVSGSEIISNDGVECEAQGFLKNDTLSVAVLDIQRDCLKLIKDDVKLPYTFDDPKVYETICKNPLGVFQLEKAAGRQGVEMVQPENFNELMAIISLIRPGARNSGMDKLYCDYKFGRKEPEYPDPRLKEILGKTQGLMVFQEDLMAVARELAGMSDLETDQLRRAISKKKKEVFTEFKPKFLDGCKKNNVDDKVAEKLWNDMEKSADYSFNRSHACGYAVLGYQSAWLKTYYPLEFAVAMLQNTKADYKIIEILHMIKDSNAELLNPDINRSQKDTTINGNEIVIGLNLIDKVSDKVSTYIINERKKHGDFKSFEDFCQRVAPRQCNKRVKENLISAGAFDNIPIVHKEQDKQSRLI